MREIAFIAVLTDGLVLCVMCTLQVMDLTRDCSSSNDSYDTESAFVHALALAPRVLIQARVGMHSHVEPDQCTLAGMCLLASSRGSVLRHLSSTAT